MAGNSPRAPEMIPLMDAAAQLRLDYHQTLKLVLRGELRGEKCERHWFVSQAAVSSLMRQRGVMSPAAAIAIPDAEA